MTEDKIKLVLKVVKPMWHVPGSKIAQIHE